MNIELLQALLATWPSDEAVRVCDDQGQVVAQNGRALEAAAQGYASASTCSGAFWEEANVRERTLLGGWHIHARPVGQDTLPPSREGAASPSLHSEVCADCQDALGSAAPFLGHFPDAPPHSGGVGDKPIELQTLARGIVHELRNPLAAIVTAAGLIQDDPDASAETVMLLGVIRKESQRMNRILSEFAAYVRPRPPQPAPFDLAEAVRQELRDVLSEREDGLPPIAVEDSLPPELSVHADEEHLRDVLRHVLRNSSQAMQGGGSLSLKATSQDEKVVLQLTDSGTGLSAEAEERAFQPFFSSKSQSTGLGLSISRSEVEASGGRIWIENVTGDSGQALQGARAFIELPSA